MFDIPDFYPTPAELASEMLSHVSFGNVRTILEPSAGDGKLIDAIQELRRSAFRYYDIDTIEVQPELRSILRGKGYRVVHDDFLTLQTCKHYDLIIANPPFSDGGRHLLKMLEMQEDGGAVICLLNAETLRNPRSDDGRKLLRKLEDADADIEYITGAFKDASRPTGVDVALVSVFYPEPERHSLILDGLRREERYEAAQEYNTLVDNNPFKAIVQQYQFEVRAGINLIREYYAMRRTVLADSFQGKFTMPIIKLEVNSSAQHSTTAKLVNEYIAQVRRKYWRTLFSLSDFIGSFTSRLRKEFYNRVEELKDYDFSYYNILELRLQMSAVMVQGLEEEVDALFDELSRKYHWIDLSSENTHYFNGWKTNKSWFINQRVIFPGNGWSESHPAEYKPAHGNAATKLLDLELVFRFLEGDGTSDISVVSALKQAEQSGVTKNIACRYFNVSFYRKGTCHVFFTDLDLLRKFNIRGSRRKNWLPPSYGRCAYEDMDTEEQAVIDSFEGKASYEQTLRRKDYFLSGAAGFQPMLESGKDEGVAQQ